MSDPKKFWIEWCLSSYRPGHGYITHAVSDDGDGRALCGVNTDEGQAGVVGADGEPGCRRCRKVLRNLGVIK